jgi:hypothetical protein
MPGSQTKREARPSTNGQSSLAALPPADTSRWVAKRKAQVVSAVQAGLLTLDEALLRYKLTLEEFSEWQRAMFRHGLRGLQVTHSQICRLADRRKRQDRKTRLSWSGRNG